MRSDGGLHRMLTRPLCSILMPMNRGDNPDGGRAQRRAVLVFWLCLLAGWLLQPGSAHAQPDSTLRPIVLAVPEPLRFRFAGYLAAESLGYYRAQGLSLKIVVLDGGAAVRDAVLKGTADVGVDDSGALLDRLSGRPLKVLASISQRSPYAIVARYDTNIVLPADLIGRNILVANGDGRLEALATLAGAAVPIDRVSLVNGRPGLDDLLTGTADAIVARVDDVSEQARARGIPVREITPTDYGVEFYGENLITSEQELDSNAAAVEAFRDASLLGWRDALDRPDEFLGLIIAHPDAAAGVSVNGLRSEARRIRQLAIPNLVAVGTTSPERWERLARRLQDFNLVPADSLQRLSGFVHERRPLLEQPLVRGLIAGISALGLIAGGVLVWNVQLRRVVRARTGEITDKNRVLVAEMAHRARAEAQAAGRLQRLEVLHGISTGLLESLNEDDLIARTLRDLQAAIPSCDASFWTIDANGGLVYRDSVGPRKDAGPDHASITAPFAVDALRGQEHVEFADLRVDPRPVSGLLCDTRAMLLTPLSSAGDPLGVICLRDAEPHAWSDHEKALVREVANYLAAALRAAAFESERRQLIEKLARSQEQYRELFERCPWPMWLLETEPLRCLAVNRAAVREYGFELSDYAGTGVLGDAQATQLLRTLASHGTIRQMFTRHRRRDGTEIAVLVSTSDASFVRPGARLAVAAGVPLFRDA